MTTETPAPTGMDPSLWAPLPDPDESDTLLDRSDERREAAAMRHARKVAADRQSRNEQIKKARKPWNNTTR